MSARVKQTSVAQQESSNMGVMQFSMCTSEVSFSYVSTRLLRKRCQLCVSSRHFHQIWCSCGLHLIFSVIVLVLKPMYLHPISSFGHKLWEKSYLSYASWMHRFEGAEQIEVCLRILVNSQWAVADKEIRNLLVSFLIYEQSHLCTLFYIGIQLKCKIY